MATPDNDTNYDAVDMDTSDLTEDEVAHMDAKLGVTIFEQATEAKRRIKHMRKIKKIRKRQLHTQPHHISSIDITTVDATLKETSLPNMPAKTLKQVSSTANKQNRRKINKPKRIVQLQCDFCGKTSVKVKHHSALSLKNGAAKNFCRPNDRSRDSRCFTAYRKWIDNYSLDKGLPHIVQKEYADQLKSKNYFTDSICHYCSAKKKTSTLVKVPTSVYNTYTPMLHDLDYQAFCKDTDCLRQFVHFIECLQQGTPRAIKRIPYIMKHIKFTL